MQRFPLPFRAFALGTILVVLFVYPLSDVRSKSGNFANFSTNATQNNEFNADADSAKKNGFDDSAKDSVRQEARFDDATRRPRIDRDERGVPIRLSTPIVRFAGRFRTDAGARDVSVDLIGAIHIAEADYYAEINRTFRDYETVVFELIVGRGVDVRAVFEEARRNPKSSEISANPLNAISTSQQFLGRALDLVYQADEIDYLASNLRRGDAFAEDFLLQIFKNNDVPNFLFNAFVQSLVDRTSGQTAGAALALAVAKNKRTTLRRIVAADLAAAEFSGNEIERENALVHYRNQIALDVVRDELNSGKTKLALFYGAAHLPDLARRIEAEFGLKAVGEPRWIPAWKMESNER